MNYGPAKIDSQFALDYGFADEFCSRPGGMGPQIQLLTHSLFRKPQILNPKS
jgi:hypothetical protein